MKHQYAGSCLCGNVKYSGETEIKEYGFCHCESCRKASGSAFSANLGVESDNFKFSDPNESLKEFTSSPGTHRFFCSNCGSPIFSKIDSMPGFVRIRLGSLDTFFDKKPNRHIFVTEKADWFDICDEAQQFDGRYPN